MTLSVLICSLKNRGYMLQKLVGNLRYQMQHYCLGGCVEIKVAVDEGLMSIGCKRNQLMRQAAGDYVCFVDDDDTVSPEYLPLLVEACSEGHDCVGIVGDILWKGEHKPFTHSIQYQEWKYDKGIFTRPPNHLNPVKREIACQFPFPEKDRGEDFDYSVAMQKAGVLKTETFVPQTVYFYTPNGS